jgi:hypothetical protein
MEVFHIPTRNFVPSISPMTRSFCSIASLLLLTCIPQASAQSGARQFKPLWKLNEHRTCTMVREEKEVAYSEVVEDTTYTNSSTFKVTGEDPDGFVLEVRYANVALRAVTTFYAKLGEELDEYQELVLVYKVDKSTGAAALQNWKEAQAFMERSFEAITELVEKRTPDASSAVKLVLAPVRGMFKSKESIEAYMQNEIGFLLFPFGKTFTPGDTLRLVESTANPFNPKDSVSQTTRAWPVDADGPGGRCEVHAVIDIDLGAFKEMMVTLMRNMGGSAGVADSTMDRHARQMDALVFAATNSMVISFDEATTWPIQVVSSSEVVADDPRGRREKTVRSVTTVR